MTIIKINRSFFNQMFLILLFVCIFAPYLYADSLILYSTFDSPEAITNPVVGLPGTCIAESNSFISGVKGNSYVADKSQNHDVWFPKEVIPADRGCIELWGKIIDYPTEIPWGKNPAFCYISGGGFTYQIQFDGNDGGGIGGLTARAGNGNVGSGSYASPYTYAGILGNADTWHHYAVVWDIDGVPGSTNTIEIYLDGKLYSSSARNNPTELATPTDGQFSIPLIYSSYNGSVAIDELKIWNYAKTHFVIPEPGIVIGLIGLTFLFIRRK